MSHSTHIANTGFREIRLALTLQIAGPMLIRATEPGNAGVDTPALRDPLTGRPVIPATHIKGKLREAYEQLYGLADGAAPWDLISPEELFGQAALGTELLPGAGALKLTNLVCQDSGMSARLTRIEVDNQRGSVADGALQVLELAVGVGQNVTFAGEVSFICQEECADGIRRCLERAFLWIEQVGGLRSIGFGRISNASLEMLDRTPQGHDACPEVLNALQSGRRVLLRVVPEEPFCVARPGPQSNIFVSEDFIPGNSIKGGIAATWLRRWGRGQGRFVSVENCPNHKELAASFEKVRFCHALPGPAGAPRPRFPSKSWAQVGPFLVDMAWQSGPLIARIDGMPAAPSFSPSWKGDVHRRVERECGWRRARRVLWTRCALDRSKRRAKDEQLFTSEMVVPTEGTVWTGSVDLARVDPEQRRLVAEQLIEILGLGIDRLGKTKTRARLELLGVAEELAVPTSKRVVIVLESEALLCNPHDIDSEGGLGLAYATAWSDLTNGHWIMKSHFTEERLAGGSFLRARFMSGPTPRTKAEYEPFLVTAAGSAFLLEQATEDSGETDPWTILCDLHRCGLGIPSALADHLGGGTWRQTPFVAENGFGEFRVLVEPEGIAPAPLDLQFEEISTAIHTSIPHGGYA